MMHDTEKRAGAAPSAPRVDSQHQHQRLDRQRHHNHHHADDEEEHAYNPLQI
ncbi:hypothetical protein MMC29_005933, partial [Sticta canariensis]|nr:hypothetical protein [Sticta canariensis]